MSFFLVGIFHIEPRRLLRRGKAPPRNDTFYYKNDGSKQDKSYGLGRVGFPHEEPAVAEQAVSI